MGYRSCRYVSVSVAFAVVAVRLAWPVYPLFRHDAAAGNSLSRISNRLCEGWRLDIINVYSTLANAAPGAQGGPLLHLRAGVLSKGQGLNNFGR